MSRIKKGFGLIYFDISSRVVDVIHTTKYHLEWTTLRSYYKISHPIVRRRVYALVKALSGNEIEETENALDAVKL